MLVRDHMSMPAVTIRADADYKTALDLMQHNALHHLPVISTQGKLVGMAAERDLLIAATRFLQSSVEVGDVMHAGVVTATPEMSLGTAANLMLVHRIGSLPVVDRSGDLVGIITEGNILKTISESSCLPRPPSATRQVPAAANR